MRKLRRLWMQLRATKGGEHSDRDLADELEAFYRCMLTIICVAV